MTVKILMSHILLLGMLWGGAGYGAASPAEDFAGDDFVREFILASVPLEAKRVDGDVIINANRGTESIADKVGADVYTFVLEGEIYTVVDFYAVEKLGTLNDVTFGILTNDYLRPLEFVAGAFYLKNSIDDGWAFSRELDGMMGLHGAELYSGQLNANKPYIRMILCFVSDENPEAKSGMPEYVLNYYQPDTLNIPVVPIVIAALVVLVVVCVVVRRRRR